MSSPMKFFLYIRKKFLRFCGKINLGKLQVEIEQKYNQETLSIV